VQRDLQQPGEPKRDVLAGHARVAVEDGAVPQRGGGPVDDVLLGAECGPPGALVVVHEFPRVWCWSYCSGEASPSSMTPALTPRHPQSRRALIGIVLSNTYRDHVPRHSGASWVPKQRRRYRRRVEVETAEHKLPRPFDRVTHVAAHCALDNVSG
jgi:hypothetical protein